MREPVKSEFEQASESQADVGLFRELWDFLRHNKKWWLLPMIVVFLLFGLLLLLSATPVAPFIYTFF